MITILISEQREPSILQQPWTARLYWHCGRWSGILMDPIILFAIAISYSSQVFSAAKDSRSHFFLHPGFRVSCRAYRRSCVLIVHLSAEQHMSMRHGMEDQHHRQADQMRARSCVHDGVFRSNSEAYERTQAAGFEVHRASSLNSSCHVCKARWQKDRVYMHTRSIILCLQQHIHEHRDV